MDSSCQYFVKICKWPIEFWMMGRSGLLPLEPTECLLDSPYFREKLHAYEKELENTSTSIKGLTKDIKELLDASKSK